MRIDPCTAALQVYSLFAGAAALLLFILPQ